MTHAVSLSHADLLAQAKSAAATQCTQFCELIGYEVRFYGDQTTSPQPTWHADITSTWCCECDPGRPCGGCTLSSGDQGNRQRCVSLGNDTGVPTAQPLAALLTATQISFVAPPTWTAQWDYL